MRSAPDNFTADGLKDAIALCHAEGVAVHVACNTLPRDEELETLPEWLTLVDEAGADAIIAADLGVMALCRTSKCAERMTKQFASHTVEKTYLCVVKGELNETINPEDYLLKDERGMVRVVSPDTKGAKRASLTAAPIAHADGLTLVKVELHTGRSHQIRVQMAHAGYPLWGDNRYGDGRPGQQIALWAASLALDHPTTKQRMCFDCPPPDMQPWNIWRISINDGIIDVEMNT